MDKLKKLSNDLTVYNFFWIFVGNLLGIGTFVLAHNALNLPLAIAVGLAVIVAFSISLGLAKLVMYAATQPLKAIWQAVWHISPHGEAIAAPNTETLTHGQDLATALVRQIYELSGGGTSTVASDIKPEPALQNLGTSAENTMDLLPIPIIGFDKDNRIVVCNKIACTYLGKTLEECIGKSLYDIMQLSFRGSDTLESWLEASRLNTVATTTAWDRVRLQLADDKGVKQFDMMARYSKSDSSGIETLIAIFDHTERYSEEDNSTAYVALAVHELRTPLTVLRGYIEVFEDELDSKLTPELRDFMHKMNASAQTLTAFVSNILNVARVDENQFNLSLHEANWNELLPEIAQDLELRAQVRGRSLKLDITPGLPTVAVDKVSIYEVVSNLVDNAIKYGGNSKEITVHARIAKDGSVETIVEDHGVGVPESSVKYLFTKFYRSHRSKGTVGGSGLGLYLVKAIVTAHGGQVWVQSKEGEGSKFGFTLQPYANIAAGLKDVPGGNIERQAHGWIKNHSMYRR